MVFGSIQTLTILNVPKFGTAHTSPSVAGCPVFWLSYVGRYAQAKRMHQIVWINFENYKFSPLLRGHIPSDTPCPHRAEVLSVFNLGTPSFKKSWIRPWVSGKRGDSNTIKLYFESFLFRGSLLPKMGEKKKDSLHVTAIKFIG